MFTLNTFLLYYFYISSFSFLVQIYQYNHICDLIARFLEYKLEMTKRDKHKALEEAKGVTLVAITLMSIVPIVNIIVIFNSLGHAHSGQISLAVIKSVLSDKRWSAKKE